MMAHVHGKPRCDRCKEFRPTTPTQVGPRVMQLCFPCQSAVGWTDDVALPTPQEAGPRAATRPRSRKQVVAPPQGFTLPELPSA